MPRRRLDDELVRRGLSDSVEASRTAIAEGVVVVDGSSAVKPETLVKPSSSITLSSAAAYVSRGGDKLAGALDDLGVDVHGRRCLDAGAGSGGFTDCLLKRGADHVVAVDVGYGQFEWGLRNDPRVTLLERTNLRTVSIDRLDGPFGSIVADLSFISLRLLVGRFAEVSGPGTDWVMLVKPQFEARRGQVGAGGIVTDPAIWEEVLHSVITEINDAGAGVRGAAASRLKGAKGNQEFFVHGVFGEKPGEARIADVLRAVN